MRWIHDARQILHLSLVRVSRAALHHFIHFQNAPEAYLDVIRDHSDKVCELLRSQEARAAVTKFMATLWSAAGHVAQCKTLRPAEFVELFPCIDAPTLSLVQSMNTQLSDIFVSLLESSKDCAVPSALKHGVSAVVQLHCLELALVQDSMRDAEQSSSYSSLGLRGAMSGVVRLVSLQQTLPADARQRLLHDFDALFRASVTPYTCSASPAASSSHKKRKRVDAIPSSCFITASTAVKLIRAQLDKVRRPRAGRACLTALSAEWRRTAAARTLARLDGPARSARVASILHRRVQARDAVDAEARHRSPRTPLGRERDGESFTAARGADGFLPKPLDQ
jgi:hypothetical protein